MGQCVRVTKLLATHLTRIVSRTQLTQMASAVDDGRGVEQYPQACGRDSVRKCVADCLALLLRRAHIAARSMKMNSFL